MDKQLRVVARATGRKLEIDVIDNGLGIDPAERSELFDGFVRGRAALDHGAPGVGLGLAIVRAIVRAHRGKIEVMSEPGHGSTFRLILPRAAAPASAPVTTPSAATASGAAP
jgi:signal transduction histidine kinase